MGTFLGMFMDQHWMDLFLWERFFNEHTIRTLVELGTGHGGMSTFLALQCRQRGIRFLTYDNISSAPLNSPVPELVRLGEAFHLKDVFADETIGAIAAEIAVAGRPACFFFDNGLKPKEWLTYFPHAASGDYLAVHDWEVEFKAGDAVGGVVKLFESEPRSAYKTVWFQKS